ncbi:hypothetical protein F2Q70_00043229 [Brassica cretica]|uniref:Uncharacterized protein n=1 Tax=Brassica cretica TaxID=69181 RepID=A0A8S9KJQ7_BRACR|nr:hypothetical protein F2Q70_00043229 [Brassica cretica]
MWSQQVRSVQFEMSDDSLDVPALSLQRSDAGTGVRRVKLQVNFTGVTCGRLNFFHRPKWYLCKMLLLLLRLATAKPRLNLILQRSYPKASSSDRVFGHSRIDMNVCLSSQENKIKQSDVVSSLNSHHLIIVVSSLNSHHLNQRQDPNRLTISSLTALTPHHLISSHHRRHSSSSLLQRANQRRDPNHLISSHHGDIEEYFDYDDEDDKKASSLGGIEDSSICMMLVLLLYMTAISLVFAEWSQES